MHLCDCFILFLFFNISFFFSRMVGPPLHIAAEKGFEEIVKIFIGHGANVNIQNKVFFIIIFF